MKIFVIHPSAEHAQTYYKGKHMVIGTATGQLNTSMKDYWENVKDKWMDQCFIVPPATTLNSQATSMLGQQAQTKTPYLRRLTTSGDWTVCVNEQDKLVAFNGRGEHLVAEGSLLSVDGKAWLFYHGQLWSGELSPVETELQKTLQEINEKSKKASEKRRKVEEKYKEKFAKLDEQYRTDMNRVAQES